MNHLTSITCKKKHLLFEAGRTFNFDSGFNLLVGEQGSGKSTLLKTILKADKEVISYTVKDPTQTLPIKSFDFEKDNPRMQSHLTNGIVGFQIASRFSSHGETNIVILESLLENENALILLDEPEMALSPKNQKKMCDILSEVSKKNQVIASTHCIVLLSEAKKVIDMSDGAKTKTGEKYLRECGF